MQDLAKYVGAALSAFIAIYLSVQAGRESSTRDLSSLAAQVKAFDRELTILRASTNMLANSHHELRIQVSAHQGEAAQRFKSLETTLNP